MGMQIKVWNRLAVWWILLTVIYVSAQFAEFRPAEYAWMGALGLFVPFALGVFVSVVFGGIDAAAMILLPFILLGLGCWHERRIVEFFRLGAVGHILLNLVFLFILTILVDYLVVGDWMSMGAFLQSLGIESPFVSHFSF